MRNQAFALPIEFSWKVARGGYRWIAESGKRYLCAVEALEKPDWPDPFDRYQQIYRPLEERTGLFRAITHLTHLSNGAKLAEIGAQISEVCHEPRSSQRSIFANRTSCVGKFS